MPRLRILGVPDTAVDKEITKAFRNIAIQHHPDKGFRKSDEGRAASDRIFRAAREAYEILLDPQRRREFDSGTGEFAAPNV